MTCGDPEDVLRHARSPACDKEAAVKLSSLFKAPTDRPASAALLVLAMLLPEAGAHADEGGVPFWFSGAVREPRRSAHDPRLVFAVAGLLLQRHSARDRSLPRGDSVASGSGRVSRLVLSQPTYAPETKLFGGQLAIGVGFGYGRSTTTPTSRVAARHRVRPKRLHVRRLPTSTRSRASPGPSGVHNWMTYLTGDIPVGDYDSERLSNVGIGHAAVDAGGGYTYLDEKTGREFSAVFGLTYNFENPDTDYRSGIDSHLDFAASQFLSAHWQVGIAGYAYYQLTGDSGSGATSAPSSPGLPPSARRSAIPSPSPGVRPTPTCGPIGNSGPRTGSKEPPSSRPSRSRSGR